MGIGFTAIDFETANGRRGSPCSVGLVKVRDGVVIEEQVWLMRPPPQAARFDRRNIAVHGITPDMVADAPPAREVLGRIRDFVGEDVMVAHNAAFDLGVYFEAARFVGLDLPPARSACTVRLARRTYRLPSYSLPFAARAAGAALEHHHDALEDARACAGIMNDVAGRHEHPSIEQLCGALGTPVRHWPAAGGGQAAEPARYEQLRLFDLTPARAIDADREGEQLLVLR